MTFYWNTTPAGVCQGPVPLSCMDLLVSAATVVVTDRLKDRWKRDFTHRKNGLSKNWKPNCNRCYYRCILQKHNTVITSLLQDHSVIKAVYYWMNYKFHYNYITESQQKFIITGYYRIATQFHFNWVIQDQNTVSLALSDTLIRMYYRRRWEQAVNGRDDCHKAARGTKREGAIRDVLRVHTGEVSALSRPWCVCVKVCVFGFI